MNQRIRVLQELGEEFKRAVAEAPDPGGQRSSQAFGRRDRLRSTSEARWPRYRRRLAASVAVLPVVGAIVVTVVVVAVALISFKHGRASVSATGAGRASSPREQLIQTLGVLRSPQTKADLDPELRSLYIPFAHGHNQAYSGPSAALAQWGHPALDQPLIRVVSIPGWGAKVMIAPSTYQPSPRSRRRSEGLNVALRNPGSNLTGTGPRPTTVASLRTHGLTVVTGSRDGTTRGVVIVPDGVARITLGPFRLLRAPAAINPGEIANATSTVHDNVAAFQLSRLTAASHHPRSSLVIVPAAARATWFDANGKVNARTTTDLNLLVSLSGRAEHAHVLHG